MFYIIESSNNPQWNLACEEYLFKGLNIPIIRLWQNSPSVIIGLHQNSYAEINHQYVRENNIPVVRRLSGGGAVFHDLGNINFTFIDERIPGESNSEMFARFTAPIVRALHKLGIEAYLEGRNDLMIKGMKFSGNAVATYRNRVLQHGTLLFSSSISNLDKALISRAEQFKDKSVKSIKSRVTNISEHLEKKITISQFLQHITNSLISERGQYNPYIYTVEDLAAIAKLHLKKYSQDSWNWGLSPKFSYSKSSRFPFGLLELHMEVEQGIIKEIKFFGNFFFNLESSGLEELLRGTPLTPEAIERRIEKINLPDYFNGIAKEEFLSIFF
ncbi:MAG: lipoate--protein ligase [Bacteroidales bacterium]